MVPGKTWSREEYGGHENKILGFPARGRATDWPQMLDSEIRHHVSTQVALPMGHSQTMTEHGRDTKAGLYLWDGTFLWRTFLWFCLRTPQWLCQTLLELYWSTQPSFLPSLLRPGPDLLHGLIALSASLLPRLSLHFPSQMVPLKSLLQGLPRWHSG